MLWVHRTWSCRFTTITCNGWFCIWGCFSWRQTLSRGADGRWKVDIRFANGMFAVLVRVLEPGATLGDDAGDTADECAGSAALTGGSAAQYVATS